MAFIPPFCPHTGCDNHHPGGDVPQSANHPDPPHSPARRRWWVRRGSFWSGHSGAVSRFSGRCCGRSFSSRSFSVHFATHRLIDLESLAARINGGEGIRSIARELGCSANVVRNRIARLARVEAENAQLLEHAQRDRLRYLPSRTAEPRETEKVFSQLTL